MKKMLFALLLCVSNLIIAEQQYKLTINNTTNMGLYIDWARYSNYTDDKGQNSRSREGGDAGTIPSKKSQTLTLPANIFLITGADKYEGHLMGVDETTFKSGDTFTISITKTANGYAIFKATKN